MCDFLNQMSETLRPVDAEVVTPSLAEDEGGVRRSLGSQSSANQSLHCSSRTREAERSCQTSEEWPLVLAS